MKRVNKNLLSSSKTAPKTPQRHARRGYSATPYNPDIMHSGDIMSPRFRSDEMLGGGYGPAPATSYTATKTAPPRYHERPHRVPRSRPATRSAEATPWREAVRRGIAPWCAARRGPATSYTATSTVPPGIMHDGAPRSRPAARSAAASPWCEAALGVGPHRGWRTSARRGAAACVGQFVRGATWRTLLRLDVALLG